MKVEQRTTIEVREQFPHAFGVMRWHLCEKGFRGMFWDDNFE